MPSTKMTTRIRVPAMLVAFLCVGLPPNAAGVSPFWPRFHGPKGDNISSDTRLLKQWPEAGPRLLWIAEGLGQGYASVTLAGGMIYTAGDSDKQDVVTAMDLDGKVRWRFENGPSWQKSVPGARGTPTVDRGRVYHESALGSVVSLDARTGRRIWGRDLVKELGGRYGGWGYAESLVVDGRHVICCPGGDTAIVALEKESGKIAWRSPSAGEPAGYATPIVAECGRLRMVLTMSERSLIGVNADTGALLWKLEHVNPNYVANCVTPVYHEGRVFVSCGYGKGCALLKVNVSGKSAAVEPVWSNTDLDNRHGGVLLLDGHLYGASQVTHKGRWVCLDWETGRLSYAEKGVGEGSVTSAAGMLYVLSEQRKVGLLRATPTGHEVVSQFQLPQEGGGASWAHPVVCGGRLYLRYGSRLYAYDVRAD